VSPDAATAEALLRAPVAEPAGRLRRGWRRVLRRPASAVGGVIVLFFASMALGAPWIATTDPLRTDWAKVRKAPTWANPLGTDDLGRDNLSRVVWGSRISMQA